MLFVFWFSCWFAVASCWSLASALASSVPDTPPITSSSSNFTPSIKTKIKIKHVLVLMQENRPFDHFFGWAQDVLPGINGLTGEEFNYVDPSQPESSAKVYVDNKCPYLNECDPGHGTDPTTFKIFEGYDTSKPPTNGGFVAYEAKHADKNYCNVMSGFSPERIPVITALAKEFAIMDRFFAAHPGPTWPNRMFALSGTSAGSTETSVWYHDKTGLLFPQRTIFDQVEEAGLEWRVYYNDTPWEMFMEKVAHNPQNLKPMDQFYADAANGNLPAFAWINPRSGINITTGVGSNDQHPDHDINAGEQFYKDIYESLRASPQWNETLFVITYDEHGGFYDHVISPTENIPSPGDGEISYPGDFNFDRLGVRIPTLLISPWIKKGTVISSPPEDAKPSPNSEFDLTSILSSTRKLLGIENTPLTKRDAWSASFDFAINSMEAPRIDCPLHLPDALPPVVPEEPEHQQPLNSLQQDIATVHAYLAGGEFTHKLQGEHSVRIQEQFNIHAAKTTIWQEYKSEDPSSAKFRVVTQPINSYRDQDDDKWNMNGLRYGGNPTFSHSTAPYITVSSLNLRVTQKDNLSLPLCLDAGLGTVGTILRVTPCYPSENPESNRDKSQHFVFDSHGQLKFYDEQFVKTPDKFLCVTTIVPEVTNRSSLAVSLQYCTREVGQSWAFHGDAPGNDGGGQIEYGDYENSLGIITF